MSLISDIKRKWDRVGGMGLFAWLLLRLKCLHCKEIERKYLTDTWTMDYIKKLSYYVKKTGRQEDYCPFLNPRPSYVGKLEC